MQKGFDALGFFSFIGAVAVLVIGFTFPPEKPKPQPAKPVAPETTLSVKSVPLSDGYVVWVANNGTYLTPLSPGSKAFEMLSEYLKKEGLRFQSVYNMDEGRTLQWYVVPTPKETARP